MITQAGRMDLRLTASFLLCVGHDSADTSGTQVVTKLEPYSRILQLQVIIMSWRLATVVLYRNDRQREVIDGLGRASRWTSES